MDYLFKILGANPSADLLKTLLHEPSTTPQNFWESFSPERKEMFRNQAEERKQKRRERLLRNATPEELAKIPRARLVLALARQKLVLTVREMAALSGFDIETIRRRIKDGTLPKVPRIRIIHVYYHHFLRWLQGVQRAT